MTFVFLSCDTLTDEWHVSISSAPPSLSRYRSMLWNEMSPSSGDKEYDAILGDVAKLEAPEDEVSGADKIIVASRMRQSYLCFSMN